MSSRRLPGKVLSELGGRPLLDHCLDRLSRCRNTNQILIATSNSESDDPIARFAREREVECFRGDLDDVAGRILAAGRHASAEAIVRISGDSPFIDPAIVDRAVALHAVAECDLVTNVFPRSYPKGMSVEIISCNALARICAASTSAEQREHVTKHAYDHPERFSIVSFTRGQRLDNYAFTVDAPEDLEFARALVAALGRRGCDAGIDELVAQHDVLRPATPN